ncbi:hypothetical protein LPC10_17705 [Methylorubrum sp. B1-46]|uniref:hypothetical protein n=1 Tax=Methylorubrum TaxID=2282523 RepID=UPI001E387674|nr:MULTISPECIES: hypothetical protein [Methylorubrum]MCG5246872.1 hypothetical protein [Methylorubrum extorquens]UGB24766.1 hypothetical protein LPC10_17705 [Methylorubrum sp. B1-46]
MSEPKPLTFTECADPQSCRDAIRPLLAPGMTWSEVHCGRCGRQGIVLHADLGIEPPVPVEADVPAPEPEPDPAPADEPAPVTGGKR